MSDKKKWKPLQRSFLYELCELLCVRSETFGRNIFPALVPFGPSFSDEPEQSHDQTEGALNFTLNEAYKQI